MERSSLIYPTKLLFASSPERDCRVVREVVFEEMERLSSRRLVPDIVATCQSVVQIYYDYRRLEFSLPELLSVYEGLAPSACDAKRPSAGQIPWEIVPPQLMERCLDDNFELQVTDELLEFLGYSNFGFDSGVTTGVFSRVDFKSRKMSRDSEELIKSPVYNKQGIRVQSRYYFMDSETGDFRQALVGNPQAHYTKTAEELEYVVDHLGPEAPSRDATTGLSQKRLLSTIDSIGRLYLQSVREYNEQKFPKRFSEVPIAVIHREKREQAKEYAISRNGKFTEDTSNLWRMVQNGRET